VSVTKVEVSMATPSGADAPTRAHWWFLVVIAGAAVVGGALINAHPGREREQLERADAAA
jgi:hypothetical protein